MQATLHRDTPREERLSALEDQIAELAAQLTAAEYRLLKLIADFDDAGGWDCGFNSCAHWLGWRIGLSASAAREKVRVARALKDLPAISAAFAQGRVSYSKVRAMTRVATPRTESSLLDIALSGTARHVEQVVKTFRRANAVVEAAQAESHDATRSLRYHTDASGMVIVQARLSPEQGAAFIQAIEQASVALRDRASAEAGDSAEAPQGDQLQADALTLTAEAALHSGFDSGTRGDRTQIVVHVDAEVLSRPESDGACHLQDGPNIPAQTMRRLCCDASIVPMVTTGDGAVLDVGRKTRTIPPAIRRALRARDGCCRFPGCDHRRYVDAHHIIHWADGGETKLSNLVHLCGHHHRAVHEGEYRIERAADGELRFVTAAGFQIAQAPALPRCTTPLADIRATNPAGIGADTLSVWAGEFLDAAFAVDGLLQLNS